MSSECEKRVRGQALHAARQAPLEFELQRMVVRRRGIVGHGDELKVRIRVEQLRDPKQVAADRADVRRRETLVASERLLQRHIPLIAPRKLQMRVRDQNGVDGRIER